MARSDRKLVRRNLEFVANHIDSAMLNLMQIDQLARGRSKKIDEMLPKLVELLDTVRKIVMQFRHEL